MTQYEKECLAICALMDSPLLRDECYGKAMEFTSVANACIAASILALAGTGGDITAKNITRLTAAMNDEKLEWWRGYLSGVCRSGELSTTDRHVLAIEACGELFGRKERVKAYVVGL